MSHDGYHLDTHSDERNQKRWRHNPYSTIHRSYWDDRHGVLGSCCCRLLLQLLDDNRLGGQSQSILRIIYWSTLFWESLWSDGGQGSSAVTVWWLHWRQQNHWCVFASRNQDYNLVKSHRARSWVQFAAVSGIESFCFRQAQEPFWAIQALRRVRRLRGRSQQIRQDVPHLSGRKHSPRRRLTV